MSENPYQSPEVAERAESRTNRIFRGIIAIGCWFASLVPPFLFWVLLQHPMTPKQFHHNPTWFVTLAIIMFGLPAIGLWLLGLGSWRRSRRIAWGGAAAFLPILLTTLANIAWEYWGW